jgi:multidrug efflux pump subunit AcrA (membrane-fusion protein)
MEQLMQQLQQMQLQMQQQQAAHDEQMRRMTELVQQSVNAQQTQAQQVQAQFVAQQQQQAAQAQIDAQRGQQQRSSSDMAPIIDPKVLEKLPNFDGSEHRFLEWETVFVSVAGLIGIEDSMAVAVAAADDREVTLAELGDEDIIRQAKALYCSFSALGEKRSD